MDYNKLFRFDVGDKVMDGLTGKTTTIIGVSYSNGYVNGNRNVSYLRAIGYWIDSDYLGGGRHPWEVWMLPGTLDCPWEKCFISQELRTPGPCPYSIRTTHGEADCGYG